MAAENRRTRGSERGDAVSDTPRTDRDDRPYPSLEHAQHIRFEGNDCVVMHPEEYEALYEQSRQLERELAAVTADLKFRRELGALQQQEYDKVTAERDALLRKSAERGVIYDYNKIKAEREAAQQEARRLRESLDAIMASAKVAYCATTDPMMTDALVGIGKRRKDAIDAELAKEGK